MTAHTTAIAGSPPTTRSRIANGTRAFLADGRSAEARLLRDRMHALAEPQGGLARMPEALRLVVRTAALVSVQIDRMMAAAARGEAVDATALAALSSQQGRLLARLEKAKPAAKAPGQMFDEHMARLAREEAS